MTKQRGEEMDKEVREHAADYDLPECFFEQFDTICTSLKEAFKDMIDNHSIDKLNMATDALITLYESFYSEKQLFDSLNACKYGVDPIYEHSVNVALLSRMLGDLNHMSHNDLYALTQSALIHDIGKLSVNPDILYKTETLTDHEFDLIKEHTQQGYMLVKDLFTDSRIPVVALMHHERIDGSGYPMGISSSDINDFTRIVAICDVYAGMIATRGYRESYCPFSIIALFEKEGLHKYDTDFTILFLRSMLDTYIGYSVILNTGEEAVITAVNPHNLSNPVVELDGMTTNLALDENRQILHIA